MKFTSAQFPVFYKFSLRIFIIILLFFIPVIAKGQFFDSLLVSLEKKPKFDFRFDSRNSFITARKAKIFGFKIGYDYSETFKFGIGYNSLSSEISRLKVVSYPDNTRDSAKAFLKFIYFSPYIEYVFHKSARWEHSIPVQIGFGNSRYEYETRNGIIREDYRPLIIYEPSMTTQYYVFPWFAVGVGLGYRLLLLNNRLISENFNSPIYVIRTRVILTELYKVVFPKKSEKEKS
jgi:hypothetical protein